MEGGLSQGQEKGLPQSGELFSTLSGGSSSPQVLWDGERTEVPEGGRPVLSGPHFPTSLLALGWVVRGEAIWFALLFRVLGKAVSSPAQQMALPGSRETQKHSDSRSSG